jgi:hypothetical protein
MAAVLRALTVASALVGSALTAVPPAAAGQPPQPDAAGGPLLTNSRGDTPPLVDGPAPPVAPEVMARDPEGRATIRAVRAMNGILVDGRLDEPVYGDVLSISGFIQSVPDVGEPTTQRTEAWVLFDENNIYVSARCWDTAPESEWVANEMRRDHGQIRENDNFGVMLDTFYDRRNGVAFHTNPLGGMVDIQVTNEGNLNTDWNAVWNVRTGRFDGGWAVEIQIPFKSLRYRPGAAQVWGVQLRRGIRRRNEWTFITRLPPDGPAGWQRLSMGATLVGLEVPPGSKNLEVKPYGISKLTTDQAVSPAFSNQLDAEAGLDVKYGVTQNLTLDFTYNTDFAQVEVDEQQVNLTRFNLVFPEKREFFLDRGLFEFGRGARGGGTGVAPEVFFSRQIGLSQGRVVPVIAGARLTGKVGKLALGALNIQTDEERVSGTPKTNFTVLRLRQDILRRSSVGLLFTGRSASTRAPGGSNQAYGVDSSLSFYENVNFSGYYARTETPGLTGRNESYQARFDYLPDRYGIQVAHLFVGDDFNPEVGFVRRDDMRRTFVLGRFSPRPRSIPSVRRVVMDGSVEYIANAAGDVETRQQAVGFDVEFQNSDRIAVDASRTYEFLDEPLRFVDGVTIPVGGYRFDGARASYTFGQQRRASASLSVGYGGFYGGEQRSLGISQGRVEITPQLSIEPGLSINWVDLPAGSFTTRLSSLRASYTFTPRMFLSAFLQHNSSRDTFSTNLRLRWEYSPGSELFVVYTEERDTETMTRRFSDLMNRALAIKINRLLRF